MPERRRGLAPMIVLLVLIGLPADAWAQITDINAPGAIVELRLQDSTLDEALNAILEGTNLSVVLPRFGTSADSIQIARIVMRDLSIAEALREVLVPQGLRFWMDGSTLRIELNIESRDIPFNFLAARFAIPLQAGGSGGQAGGQAGAAGGAGQGGVGALGGAGLTAFETRLRSMLSGPEATLIIDLEQHYLHVRDYVSNLDLMEEYIQAIDRPIRQVQIEARLVEIIYTGDSAVGVGFGADLTGSPDITSAQVTLPTAGTAADFVADLQGFRLGGVYGGNLDIDAALRALASVSNANLLSRPTTVVMDGRQANISLTDQIPYTETLFGTGSVATTTAFKDVGIIMNVIPTILDSSTVQLQVQMEFSTVPTITAGGVPTVSRRLANSPVMLHDGDLFVMAGLVREDQTTTRTGIPILGSLPLLKYLFSTTTTRKEKRELLLFVRASILNPPSDGGGGGVG